MTTSDTARTGPESLWYCTNFPCRYMQTNDRTCIRHHQNLTGLVLTQIVSCQSACNQSTYRQGMKRLINITEYSTRSLPTTEGNDLRDCIVRPTGRRFATVRGSVQLWLKQGILFGLCISFVGRTMILLSSTSALFIHNLQNSIHRCCTTYQAAAASPW